MKDLTNKRFGKLVAIKYIGNDKFGHSMWQCKCDCGTTITVMGSNLIRGHTKSC